MAVGNIDSMEVGSGARFNDGKPPYELVAIRAIAASWAKHPFECREHEQAVNVLFALADFQEGGDIFALSRAMGYVKEYWPECARTFDYGRKKYAEWNWAKGMPWSVPTACIVRHCLDVLTWIQPPNMASNRMLNLWLDQESGHHHFGHVLCNLTMLLTYISHYPQGDDRPQQLRRLPDAVQKDVPDGNPGIDNHRV